MRTKNITSTTEACLYRGDIKLKKLMAYNANAGDVWLFVHDAATVADVTPGATPTPAAKWQMLIPGGSSAARGFAVEEFGSGLSLSTGLSVSVYTVAGAAPGTALEILAMFE